VSVDPGEHSKAMRAFFLDTTDGGQRYCQHHRAQGSVKRGQLLYLHPFGEEMNKSRRMAALQARALARAGFEVLQLDLLGCGDSSGDFGDATWQAWLEDALLGCAWLQTQAERAPLWLWGLRAGCLLAAAVAARLESPANLLLVQAPASGKLLLQQFLRLRIAGDMMDGASKGKMAEMRAAIQGGETLEIAGYRLNAELALGLDAAVLSPTAVASGRRLLWLELSPRNDAQWTPAALQAQRRWREAGYAVEAALIQGPSFWQTSEIEEAPALIEACCRMLATDAPATPGVPA
jgi:uncharacterized protein